MAADQSRESAKASVAALPSILKQKTLVLGETENNELKEDRCGDEAGEGWGEEEEKVVDEVVEVEEEGEDGERPKTTSELFEDSQVPFSQEEIHSDNDDRGTFKAT